MAQLVSYRPLRLKREGKIYIEAQKSFWKFRYGEKSPKLFPG